MPTPLPYRRRSGTLLLLALLAACGGEDPVEADPDVAFLVGDWTATELLLRNPANPGSVIDVLALGGAFTINVQPSGQYTARLSVAGQPSEPEFGLIQIDGDELVLHRQSPTPDVQRARYTYANDTLTLEGDTSIDLNNDGTPEPAVLEAVLVRD